jgi:hypothetical protein
MSFAFLQGPFVALRKLIVPQIHADERTPECEFLK